MFDLGQALIFVDADGVERNALVQADKGEHGLNLAYVSDVEGAEGGTTYGNKIQRVLGVKEQTEAGQRECWRGAGTAVASAPAPAAEAETEEMTTTGDGDGADNN